MDRVFIEALEVETVIGHHEWERGIRQKLVLDIDMGFDCRAAGISDALTDALDYDAVAKMVTAMVEASQYRLLEAVADAVVGRLLRDFPCHDVRIRIRKPGAVANAVAVGVEIERSRGDA